MSRMALRLHLSIPVSLLALACQGPSPEDVRDAVLYFPPQVRHVDAPRFCFLPAERERALQEYEEGGADTLFELVVDAEGQVRRARLVRTHVRDEYHEVMEEHARRFKFTPAPEDEGYRAFYLPMRYRLDSEFEWIGE